MTPQFKLCTELGLTVIEADTYDSGLKSYGPNRMGVKVIIASDIEALLARGVRVRAYTGPASRPGGMWIDYGQHDADSDKEGLIIGIKPIKREPRRRELSEDEVREALGWGTNRPPNINDAIERLFGQQSPSAESATRKGTGE